MDYLHFHFVFFFFFFNDTATTEIYPLSLHDALPISINATPPPRSSRPGTIRVSPGSDGFFARAASTSCRSSSDRKSTRLNSSHLVISYAVFCLKKKKQNRPRHGRVTTMSAYPKRVPY